MYPFWGAIGRYRIHSARILPGRPLFCVEVPGIMHGAKILPMLGVAQASPLRRAEYGPVLCEKRACACGMFIPSISFPRYEKAEEGGNLAVYGKRPMRSREVSSPFAEELALKSLALPLGW